MKHRNRIERITAYILILVIFCSSKNPILAENSTDTDEIITSGTWKVGKNVTAVLNNNVLTISGTGDMYNYSDTDTSRNPFFATICKEKNANIQLIVEDGVTSIGQKAFMDCAGITSAVIGKDIDNIGIYAFANCTGLTEITLPEAVTYIYAYTFSGCTGLTKAVLSKNLAGIAAYAFYNCHSLTEIEFPDTLKSIAMFSFYNCSQLTEIVIPKNVNTIGICPKCNVGPFWGCSAVENIIVDSENPYYDSRNNCNAIIQTETNKLITGCNNTVIPADVTEILAYAFENCTGLKQLRISKNVSKIGNEAFSGCSGLESIEVEKENTVYDSRDNSNALIETATNTLIKGSNYSFIPDSVTSIGNKAFYMCSGLTELTIPEGVTSIGYRAFFGCTALKQLTLPSTIKVIGSDVFRGCSSLEQITNYSVNRFPLTDIRMEYGYEWYLSGTENIITDVADGNTAVFKEKIPSMEINFEEEKTLTLSIGNRKKLQISDISEEISLPDDITWISEDSKIASVDSYGIVTANAKGSTIIKAVYKGFTAVCEVTVNYPKYRLKSPEGIELTFYSDSPNAEEGILETKLIENPALTDKIYAEDDSAMAEPLWYQIYDIKLIDSEGNPIPTDGFLSLTMQMPQTDDFIIYKMYRINNENLLSYKAEWAVPFSIETETYLFSMISSTGTFIIANQPLKITGNKICGDVNDDGTIDSKDAVVLKKYLAGYTNLTIDLNCADGNADGKVDSKDAVRLLQYLAGYNVKLGE